MRTLSTVGCLVALSTYVSAIPASNHIPSAITPAAPGKGNTTGSDSISKPAPNAFDKRVAVPGTGTVFWVAEGRKVNPYSLGIVLSRAQLDLNYWMDKEGEEAVPGNPNAPRYSFLTTTPTGLVGYFFVSALAKGGLTYRLANESLAGLKIFLLDQERYEQAVFEVEDAKQMVAFGGVSVDPNVETLQALSNNTAMASDRTSLAVLAPLDVKLRCTFAKILSPAAIFQVLYLARGKAMEMIREKGSTAYLPGETGKWEEEGDLGAMFEILGVKPHRLTWQIMSGAVAAMKVILLGDHLTREAQCSMTIGDQIVGAIFVKQKTTGVDQS
ncbi:MAG: hypothetical protein Q9170_007484 [Blastenia crenularia]